MGIILERKKRIIMAQDQFVPPGYQVYDYLKCTGCSSRIDTGVPGNDNTLAFDYTYMMLSNTHYSGHFGNCPTSDYTQGKLVWRIYSGSSTYPTNMIFNAYSSNTPKWLYIGGYPKDQKIHFTLSCGSVSYTNKTANYSRSETITSDSTTAVSTENICIGSIGINITNYQPSDARFYGAFKISKGGKLIRNYIPVVRKSDNKAGFYDTVNHTFNPSIGSAEFVAGNDA